MLVSPNLLQISSFKPEILTLSNIQYSSCRHVLFSHWVNLVRSIVTVVWCLSSATNLVHISVTAYDSEHLCSPHQTDDIQRTNFRFQFLSCDYLCMATMLLPINFITNIFIRSRDIIFPNSIWWPLPAWILAHSVIMVFWWLNYVPNLVKIFHSPSDQRTFVPDIRQRYANLTSGCIFGHDGASTWLCHICIPNSGQLSSSSNGDISILRKNSTWPPSTINILNLSSRFMRPHMKKK